MADKPFLGASAPLGTIGRKLGFRWVFPIGTLPVPYHPWLALLIPIVAVALPLYWAANLLGAGADDYVRRWDALLLAMLALGLPLSLPLIQWFAYAFRLFLIQSLLALGAMALILLAVATGAEPWWLAALPLLFFGWHTAARIAGPRLLARLDAEGAALAEKPPLGPAHEAPLVIPPRRHDQDAMAIIERLNLPALYREGGDPLRATYRLAPADFETLDPVLDLLRNEKQISVHKGKDGQFISLPVDSPDDAVRISEGRYIPPFFTLKGHLHQLVARGAGKRVRAISGKAAIVGKWPLFTCFVHFSLLGARHWQWQIGFLHEREHRIGAEYHHNDKLAALFDPVAPDAPPNYSDVETVRALLLPWVEDRRDDELAGFEALIADPNGARTPVFRMIYDTPEVFAGRGRELVAALAAAKGAGLRGAFVLIDLARMVAALPDEEFRALGPELIVILNSRSLAEFNVTPTTARTPKFAGFGLLKHAPQLYARLGEIPEARALVMALGEMFGWPEPLAAARERLYRDAPRE